MRSPRPRPSVPPSGNTAGLQLLSAILSAVSVADLRNIDPELIFGSDRTSLERRAYAYIRQHHDTHHALPTLAVLRENTGIQLPSIDQPVSYYMLRARQRAMVRNIHEPYAQLTEALQNPRTGMDDIVAAIEGLAALKSRFIDAGTGLENSQGLLDAVEHQFGERRMASGLTGVTTGFRELDEVLDGYGNGDLIVWVARPGRGKSWLLLNQCYAAWSAGYKPLYVSMEMGGVQNMRRLVGIHTGINPTFIRRGRIQSLFLPRFEQGLQELRDRPPLEMVTANFSRSVEQIYSLVEEHHPDIVYIDAGYLLAPRKKRFGSSGRRETISDVIEELKELAVNINRPVVITVQFNRTAEHRRRAGAGASPISHLSLAEIGETDAIGQAASHVLGIELAPAPCHPNDYRAFGFLKGREGEDGWWLSRYMRTQHSPVDLSIVPKSDPVYRLIAEHAQRQSRGNQRNINDVDPSQRTALMRMNAA